jgi:hypothetical protein
VIERDGPMFFPAFKGQQVSVARSDNELARMSYTLAAAEREMTVQDLLRHTAGLAYGEITVNTPVRDAYAKAGLYLAGVRDYDARDLTPAEEAERLAKAPPAHQPGTVKIAITRGGDHKEFLPCSPCGVLQSRNSSDASVLFGRVKVRAGAYNGLAAWGFCQSCRRVGCTGSAAVRRGFR